MNLQEYIQGSVKIFAGKKNHNKKISVIGQIILSLVSALLI